METFEYKKLYEVRYRISVLPFYGLTMIDLDPGDVIEITGLQVRGPGWNAQVLKGKSKGKGIIVYPMAGASFTLHKLTEDQKYALRKPINARRIGPTGENVELATGVEFVFKNLRGIRGDLAVIEVNELIYYALTQDLENNFV